MYLIQILAIVIWLFVSVSALFHFKKTVLIWMMARMLLNSQIAVRYNSPGMSAVIAVDITLILIYFFKYRTRKSQTGLRFERFPLTGAFWITLASFLLSSLFAIVPLSSGLVATLKYFISNFGIIFVFLKCLNTEEDVFLYIRTGFVVGIMIAVLGIYQTVMKDNPWLDFVYLNSPIDETTLGRMWYTPPFVSGGLTERMGMVRSDSFFGITIEFGATCIYMLYLFMTIKKYKFNVYKGFWLNAVIILILLGAIMSNSKTPIVGFVVLLFAFYGVRQMLNPKIILPLIIFFIIIIVYFPAISMSFMSLFDPKLAEEAGGSSVSMRQSQADVVLRLFSMNPLFGNGIGSISVMRNIGNNSDILGAESSFFQILPERGLLGLFAYIFTYWSLFTYGKKYIPFKLSFFFLLSVAVMEFATGCLNTTIWICVYFCVVRLFQLRKTVSIYAQQKIQNE